MSFEPFNFDRCAAHNGTLSIKRQGWAGWILSPFPEGNATQQASARRGKTRTLRSRRKFYSEVFEALVESGGYCFSPNANSPHRAHSQVPLGNAEDRGGKEANCDR